MMGPGRLSASLALLVAVVSVLASGITTAGTGFGLLGLLALAGGLLTNRSLAVLAGGGALATATVLAGLAGGSPPALLVGTGAAILSFDLGQTALETRSYDASTATTRGELAHALSAMVFVSVLGGGALLVFRAAAGQGSPVALAALLVGAVCLTAATQV